MSCREQPLVASLLVAWALGSWRLLCAWHSPEADAAAIIWWNPPTEHTGNCVVTRAKGSNADEMCSVHPGRRLPLLPPLSWLWRTYLAGFVALHCAVSCAGFIVPGLPFLPLLATSLYASVGVLGVAADLLLVGTLDVQRDDGDSSSSSGGDRDLGRGSGSRSGHGLPSNSLPASAVTVEKPCLRTSS